MDITRLAAFAGLWFLLGLSPGPNAAFCMATGFSHRFRESLAAPIGIGIASFVHVTITAIGAGAIFARSAAAFQVLKFAGVVYLVWLGIKQWRSAHGDLDISAPTDGDPRTRELLRRGMVVSLTNPQAILQYMAVLPQFIDATAPATPQFVALALVAAPIAIVDYTIYTVAATGIARSLTERRARSLRRATAGVYLLAAGALATR